MKRQICSKLYRMELCRVDFWPKIWNLILIRLMVYRKLVWVILMKILLDLENLIWRTALTFIEIIWIARCVWVLKLPPVTFFQLAANVMMAFSANVRIWKQAKPAWWTLQRALWIRQSIRKHRIQKLLTKQYSRQPTIPLSEWLPRVKIEIK